MWPARATEQLEELVRLSPEELTVGVEVERRENGQAVVERVRRPVARITHTGVYGRGIIRSFEPVPEAAPLPREFDFPADKVFSGLQFVSYAPEPGPPAASQDEQAQRRFRRSLYRKLGYRPGWYDTFWLALRGTRMRLLEPPARPWRGLAVHLSSLGGLEYEQPIADELLEKGWAVLRVAPSTARQREEPLEIDANSDMKDEAEELAELVDNRVAEIAYAVEAGILFLRQTYPEAATCPVAILGYSAGALAAPAVATRLSERVDAVVLVGGGANLLDISQRSTFTNGGIELRWRNDRKPPEAVERLNKQYLETARLDPYALAPGLEGTPVLMLHAIFDDIVPAASGELLYERLGRPERVSYLLGHKGLFWWLPSQAGWVADWVDRTATTGGAEGR
jgi:fermentation-respiration switch protein FrsA (DUF1100 family)